MNFIKHSITASKTWGIAIKTWFQDWTENSVQALVRYHFPRYDPAENEEGHPKIALTPFPPSKFRASRYADQHNSGSGFQRWFRTDWMRTLINSAVETSLGVSFYGKILEWWCNHNTMIAERAMKWHCSDSNPLNKWSNEDREYTISQKNRHS